MSTRFERDRQKVLQDKHQMILSQLLKDEDNKYCVDCDAKGPRWASWNLGIFLCIRCAGLHRNLGVHISRVKSVNLDTWTPEQIAMMQEMGNSRARAVYEANVQDNFRRPQSDSGLEALIRAKYESKKYIAREWVPPKPKIPQYDDDGNELRERKVRNVRDPVFEEMPKKEQKKVQRAQIKDVRSEKTMPVAKPVAVSRPEQQQKKPIVNLLGLDDPVPVSSATSLDDPFGAFMGSSPVVTSSVPSGASAQQVAPNNQQQVPQTNENLLGGLGNMGQVASGDSNGLESAGANDGKKSNASILALFGNNASQPQQQQQQMYGVPGGMYMQPAAAQGGMFAPMSNGMMQMNPQMGMQQAGAQMNMNPQQQMPNGYNQGNMSSQMPQSNSGGFGQMSALPQMSQSGGFAPQTQQPSGFTPQMSNSGGFPTQVSNSGGFPAQMSNSGAFNQMNMNPMQQQQMGQVPASSSMNNLHMPGSGMGGASAMYSAAPNNMYGGQQQQLQQAQQQMAALSMSGRQMDANLQYGQMGAAAAGGAGANGWAGMQQTGNTMSSNLWQ